MSHMQSLSISRIVLRSSKPLLFQCTRVTERIRVLQVYFDDNGLTLEALADCMDIVHKIMNLQTEVVQKSEKAARLCMGQKLKLKGEVDGWQEWADWQRSHTLASFARALSMEHWESMGDMKVSDAVYNALRPEGQALSLIAEMMGVLRNISNVMSSGDFTIGTGNKLPHLAQSLSAPWCKFEELLENCSLPKDLDDLITSVCAQIPYKVQRIFEYQVKALDRCTTTTNAAPTKAAVDHLRTLMQDSPVCRALDELSVICPEFATFCSAANEAIYSHSKERLEEYDEDGNEVKQSLKILADFKAKRGITRTSPGQIATSRMRKQTAGEQAARVQMEMRKQPSSFLPVEDGLTMYNSPPAAEPRSQSYIPSGDEDADEHHFDFSSMIAGEALDFFQERDAAFVDSKDKNKKEPERKANTVSVKEEARDSDEENEVEASPLHAKAVPKMKVGKDDESHFLLGDADAVVNQKRRVSVGEHQSPPKKRLSVGEQEPFDEEEFIEEVKAVEEVMNAKDESNAIEDSEGGPESSSSDDDDGDDAPSTTTTTKGKGKAKSKAASKAKAKAAASKAKAKASAANLEGRTMVPDGANPSKGGVVLGLRKTKKND
ncbi:unnamed protein product [Amoebophrya sp. A25]|nr:unnamed protein product [Amoebophrya sp. A25]|eukprot:GSA25T00027214001.1